MRVLVFLALVVLCSPAQAAERKVGRCVYSGLSNTSYADGPCMLRDLATPAGKLAAYNVSWPEGASPVNLRLSVIVEKQGQGASQELTMDGRPAVGFEMTRGRYLIVTKDARRALIIEGQ